LVVAQNLSVDSFATLANFSIPAGLLIPLAGGPAFTFYYASVLSTSGYLLRLKVIYEGGGYIGIGLGSSGGTSKMIGGTAVVGLNDPSYPAIGLYSLGGTSVGQITLLPGSLESLGIFNATFTISGPNTTLEFFYDQTLGPVQLIDPQAPNVTSMIFASGSDLTFQQHVRRTSYNVDLISGDLASQVRELDKALAAHVISAIVAFMFLFPLGASFGLCHNRAGKSSTWFQFHRAIQITAAFFALICIVCGFYHVYEMGEEHWSRPHHVIGTLVFVGVALQIANGLLRPHIHPDQPPSARRVQWYLLHRVLAFCVLFFGCVNLLLGPEVFQDAFLGSAQNYSIVGFTFSALGVEDFVYFGGACAMLYLMLIEFFGIFVRPRVYPHAKVEYAPMGGPVVAHVAPPTTSALKRTSATPNIKT